MRWGAVGLVLAFVAAGCAPKPPSPPPAAAPERTRPKLMQFEATAYSIEGRTATGTRTRRGVVAADPKVLPLGSRIRVHDAGRYSGEYVVKDTGAAVRGREIDIYLANDAEAKRFGRRNVKVDLKYFQGLAQAQDVAKKGWAIIRHPAEGEAQAAQPAARPQPRGGAGVGMAPQPDRKPAAKRR